MQQHSTTSIKTWCAFIVISVYALAVTAQNQTIRYPLINDFASTEPTAPALMPLANSNGQTGNFTTIDFDGEFCPEVSNIPVYSFEDNTGLRFDNSDNFIDCAYTIEFTYQFTAYPALGETPWLWLLGFTQMQDDGLFIYYASLFGVTLSRLEFWDDNTILATVGSSGVLMEDVWYKFTMTRDCNDVIRIYMNGSLFGGYNDNNDMFRPQANTGNEIIFFQDNPNILASEASPGHVREINISNYAKTAEEIAEYCECLCDILAADCTPSNTTEELITCDPNEVGMASDTISGPCGCDQINTTIYTLIDASNIQDTFEICSGESLFVENLQLEFSTDTTVCQSFINEAGCEVDYCATVAVIPIKETEFVAEICAGDSYLYEGNVYTETGVYTHSYMDEDGCDSLVYVDLTVFEDFSFDVNVQAPACFGENSGAITVFISGDNAPFEYSMDGETFQTFNAFLNLESGDYDIYVLDNNACVQAQSVTISSPSLLTATTSSSPEIDNQANGSTTAIAEGGTLPYIYEWNTNPIQTTETATNLSTGTYTVTVTDENNCTWEGTVEVDFSTATQAPHIVDKFEISPNPVFDKAQVFINMPTTKARQLTVYNARGQQILTQEISSHVSKNITLDFSKYAAGVYWVTLNTEGFYYTKTIVKY